MRHLRSRACLLLATFAAAAGSPHAAAASGPAFGVADDAGKYADDGGSNVFLTLGDIGFTTNRITVLWEPNDGNNGFTIREKGFLDRTVPVAALRGIDLVLDVYPLHATAFTEDTQKRITLFAEYLQLLARSYPTVTKFVIGNEPNQPRFAQPQFVRDGRGGYRATAGALYEHVLAAAYDALKDVDPAVTVVGLGLSPRGNDDPRARNNVSRSPVRFIHDLAVEYRRSGRDRPLMDELGFHPYPSSNADPLSRGYDWPNAGIPNLGRIKQAIWDGFHGTAQPVFAGRPSDTPGRSLGFELDEYGRQVTVISSSRAVYTGRENVRTISEARQAAIYSAVVRQMECEPDVRGFFFFHLIDERDLDRFQSGLMRADNTMRPSYGAVRQTLAQTKGTCTGGFTSWHPATGVIGADVTFDGSSVTVRAGEEVTATTGVFPATFPTGKILEALDRHPASARTTAPLILRPNRDLTISARLSALAPGTYVEAVSLRATMNPDRVFFAVGDPIAIGS
jgi:hypothetical protein